MDYSNDWLLALKSEYVRRNGKEPVFISDWDISNTNAKYPVSIIQSSLDKAKQSVYKYLFADEQLESKERIHHLLKSNDVESNINNITLTVSATASLYLTLLSLHKKKIKRYLVFTPVYYSILDTLNDMGANVTYFPLVDKNNFQVDLQKLLEIIRDKQIEAIIFCDPIYCGGIEIPIEVYDFMSNISNEYGIWIICDYTLGGMEWNNDFFPQLSYSKINTFLSTSYSVFIDSISKRLLVNGLKISVVIGPPAFIKDLENYAAQVYGGFSSLQIEFLKDIYLPSNANDISSIIHSNVLVMKNNHEKLYAMLKDTEYEIYPTNSGYFSMIVHRELKLKDVDSKKAIESFLLEEHVLAFPSFHFSFDDENKFGFRVNVFMDLASTIPALEKCIRKNVKRLH
jgi:aspartate/methionine/tyrosine aminotransferase